MLNLNAWFEKGMTGQEYIASMKTNQENLQAIYKKYQVPEKDRAFYEEFSGKGLRGIVLTADWCGDAMLCVPILMRIAEVAAIDMRYLIRDENLELMDQYLTNGKSRAIPIFIFIDKDGQEQAVWGPRSPEVQKLIDEMRSTLPSKESPDFEEKQKEVYHTFHNKILTEQSLWESVNRSVRERFENTMQTN